jgi:GntR family transcriptional regulator, transcriptional repressor for pyruvate dehydrogenase complex
VAKTTGPRQRRTVTPTAFREKPKLVADRLRLDIVDGQLDEGDPLGTEAELVERFEVSRPTLREALRILEAEGLISVGRGVLGGVTVHRPDQRMTARAAALVLQSRNVDLADVFDASAIIEPAAVRSVAASRVSASAAKQLRGIISEEKRAIGDVVAFANAQVRFHEEIVTLTGNRTLLIVMEMLNEVVARAVEDVIAQTRPEDVAARRRAIRSHELLVDLIETGDGEAAQAHWNTHMARLRRSLLADRGASVVDLTAHL